MGVGTGDSPTTVRKQMGSFVGEDGLSGCEEFSGTLGRGGVPGRAGEAGPALGSRGSGAEREGFEPSVGV